MSTFSESQMREEALRLQSRMNQESSTKEFVRRFGSKAPNGIADPKPILANMGFPALATDEGVEYLKGRFA